VREFVGWLKASFEVVGGGPPPPAGEDPQWIETLRSAVVTSPPLSPPQPLATLSDYLLDVSPPLAIAPERVGDFLRVALRFWVTELRPFWTALRCHKVVREDGDCVLLARVTFDVVWVGGAPTGAWQVAGNAATVTIEEGARPVLAHARMLEELALGGSGTEVLGATPAGGVHIPLLVTATSLTLGAGHYCVVCRGAAGAVTVTLPAAAGDKGRTYVVKNADVSSVLLAPSGTNKIDSSTGAPAANRKVNKGASLTVVSDGDSRWHVIATG
jgi:hypothetical protein